MHLRTAVVCVSLLAVVLVPLSANTAQAASTLYEAENSPALCTGTIDSGYSGNGFCNGTNTVGAYPQFTVNAPTRARRRSTSASPTAPAPHGPRTSP